jgi:hypothetical protein
MAHHREEFGPNEPDIPLYANYPITRASFWRKMRRDGLGSTGFRMLRGQFMSIFKMYSCYVFISIKCSTLNVIGIPLHTPIDKKKISN